FCCVLRRLEITKASPVWGAPPSLTNFVENPQRACAAGVAPHGCFNGDARVGGVAQGVRALCSLPSESPPGEGAKGVGCRGFVDRLAQVEGLNDSLGGKREVFAH